MSLIKNALLDTILEYHADSQSNKDKRQSEYWLRASCLEFVRIDMESKKKQPEGCQPA